MPPFPLIPTVLSEISFLVPGMRFLLIVLKIEEEAGGMTIETLNVLFIQISMVFIHVAEHWKDLDSTSAERSAPTSTKMKIRPVEFMRVA